MCACSCELVPSCVRACVRVCMHAAVYVLFHVSIDTHDLQFGCRLLCQKSGNIISDISFILSLKPSRQLYFTFVA